MSKKYEQVSKNTWVPTMAAHFVSFTLPHGISRGAQRPALVVKENEDGTVNLQVFTDASDELPLVWFVANARLE